MRFTIRYLLIISCFFYCNAYNKAPKNPPGYDLSKPEKFSMPESLLEISGICFYRQQTDTVYAIQDEEGKVFRLPWGQRKQLHSKFARQGDYEDLTIIKNQVVVLQSNGTLYMFPFADAIYSEVDDVQEFKHLLPDGEYESVYGDETTGNLYILCKNCPDDENKDFISGYILNLGTGITKTGSFKINVNGIKSFTGKVKRGFRPSGLAKNPVTNEWFIISAVNQILVIADSNWAIKDVSPLSGNTFNQPEGIAFDKQGNMYISNEGGDLSTGNILKFKRLNK